MLGRAKEHGTLEAEGKSEGGYCMALFRCSFRGCWSWYLGRIMKTRNVRGR